MATTEQFKSGELTSRKESDPVKKMIDAFLPEIKRALPAHLRADRMARIVMTAFRKTPKLTECDPRSILAAVIQASQLGLEPDTLGRSYLIPYGRECQFVPGWKGLVDLVNRTGQATVWSGAVFEGDDFDYALGDRPFVKHKPGDEDDPDKLTHVYAIGRVKGQEWPVIEVWSIKKVWKHRDRYNKVGKRHYSYENQEMYARKVVLLQVLKYMPASPELLTAIGLNDAAEIGEQNLTIQDAIEGTFVPMPEAHEPPPAATESKQAAASSERTKVTNTFAFIEDKLMKAKTLDTLNEAADLIRSMASTGDETKDGAMIDELKDIYMHRVGEMK